MKKKRSGLLLLFTVLLGWSVAWSQVIEAKYDFEPLYPDSAQYVTEVNITRFLNSYHFKKYAMDDTLSSHVWDNYINAIDGGKLYFTSPEIKSFEKYRYSVDEALTEGSLDAAFDVFNKFRQKYKERANYIQKFLDQPINYTSDETIDIDREKAKWALSDKELDQAWDKILINQAIGLKLTGKTDSAIVATLKSRYSLMEKRVAGYKSDHAFNFFMNAFTEYLDPHTNYMIPQAAENFNISMSQSIEGIGATLTNEGDYVIIKSIVPGGPLFKSKQGNVDDYIVAVAQGDTGDFQDIIGWLTDDAIKLIRGKKGTVVQLKLLASNAPTGATPRTVRLVRDKINIEEAVAKGNTVDLEHNGKDYKIGVVDIPMFYRDFEGSRNGGKFQSTTADVKKILTDFNKEGVDGVIIDLRNNGGGSLTEAIDLTGLFIKSGPVVQRKSSIGQGSVEEDNDKSVTYTGPLLVLQNRLSASASEIFAGAIQDYERGVIVGENSFGKGTVQQLVDLDNYLTRLYGRKTASVGVGNKAQHGQLKFTSEKFYRITGKSTQLKGVVPDVALPSLYDPDEVGEKGYPTALEYDIISPVSFQRTGVINQSVINNLNKNLEKRFKTDEDLQELLQDIEIYKKEKERNVYSLNYEQRKKEKDDFDSKMDSTKKLNKSDNKDEDIYLLESEKILGDLIAMRDNS